MVGAVLAIGVVVLLAWHAVDNSVSAEDRKYIPRYLVGIRAMPPEATRTYEDEIDFVVRVQRAVLDVAPRNEGLPFGAEREPRDLFEARRGLCFDRSRVIEKILRYAEPRGEARRALFNARDWFGDEVAPGTGCFFPCRDRSPDEEGMARRRFQRSLAVSGCHDKSRVDLADQGERRPTGAPGVEQAPERDL